MTNTPPLSPTLIGFEMTIPLPAFGIFPKYGSWDFPRFASPMGLLRFLICNFLALAVRRSGAHAVDSLLSILLTLVLRDFGQQILDQD